MAGIGDYEEGKAFELRSGNKTSYKNMASAPGKLKNFGIGPGESPVEQEYATSGGDGGGDIDESQQSNASDQHKGQGWKKALGIGVAALTSGMDAVYGSGKIMPGSSRLIKKKSDEKTKSIEDRLKELENIDKA